jgi:hypothetical protein
MAAVWAALGLKSADRPRGVVEQSRHALTSISFMVDTKTIAASSLSLVLVREGILR